MELSYDWTLATNFTIATLAILNPLGKVPVWLEACGGQGENVRFRLAAMLVGTATAILLVFLLLGQEILNLFGIDLAAFRIGGGIVVLLIGLRMLQGSVVEVSTSSAEEQGDAFERAKGRFREVVVPMAVPLIAGPGSISTTILYSSRAEGGWDLLVLSGILVVVMALVLGVLLAAPWIRARVGDIALEVLTRVFGLLLAAIAAQFIVVGLGEVFPNWVSYDSQIHDDLQESRPGSS